MIQSRDCAGCVMMGEIRMRCNFMQERPNCMKIFCKLSLIVLLLAANVHADDVPGADASENALRSAIIQPADRYELARRLTHISEIPVPPENPPARHVGEIDSYYIDNTDDATGRVKAELRAVGSTVYVWV